MNSEQQQKAQTLLELHVSPKLLVLPNVWDPITARVLAQKGYPAVATASAAVSSSLGYLDGEMIARDTMLDAVARIAKSVDIPVTADMETGYAASLDELKDTTRGLIDSGAVGMNIEDNLEEGGRLRPMNEQCDRISTVRETAVTLGVHLVINARIDAFLSDQFASIEERIEEAVTRAEAFTDAGADCVYPIGPGDADTLKTLRSRIKAPINALATPEAISLATMAELGINRVSFGPFIFRSCLKKFADIADALALSMGYECFGDEMFSRAEVAEYLRSDPETP